MSFYKNLLVLLSGLLLLSTIANGYRPMLDVDEEDRRDGYYSGYGFKSNDWEFNGIIIWIIGIIIVIIILAIIGAWIVIPLFIWRFIGWGGIGNWGGNRRPIENIYKRQGYSNDRYE